MTDHPQEAGFTAIWNDILPEGRENLYEWHNREHMPERLGISGFRRGRRFIAAQGSPEFLILYEADSLSVMGGSDYFARLNDPTPWTKRSQKNFRNSLRSVCRVVFSVGPGMGGNVLAIRSAREAPPSQAFVQTMMRDVLPPIEQRVGVAAVRLGLCDFEISGVETTEKRGRVPFGNPGWVILVEAVSEAVLQPIANGPLSAMAIAAAEGDACHAGTYRMEFCLTR